MTENINFAIMNFKVTIQNALTNINVAPTDEEKLAPQLEDWLSAQPNVAYNTTILGGIFDVSNRAINGSIMSLMRKGLVDYDIIDNIKYYYYRED